MWGKTKSNLFGEFYSYFSQHTYESYENQQLNERLSIFNYRNRKIRDVAGRLEIRSLGQCTYCSRPLTDPMLRTVSPNSSLYRRRRTFQVCNNCGWWQGTTERNWVSETLVSRTVRTIEIFEAIVKSFPVDALNAPNTALRMHLAKQPGQLADINPARFEQLLQSVYRDFFDCEVVHLGGPGDGGIDLYVVDADTPFVVQAKRRRNLESAEGVSAVREFLGALIENGAYTGHIVTTAKRFSPSAEKLAANPHLERFNLRIDLVALQDLLSILEVANRKVSHPSKFFLERFYDDF